MSSAGFIVAEYVCPTIGAILSTLTFSAPIKSLKSSIKTGSLGTLNPAPWAFMTGNCIGWLAYSYITLDLFVFAANAPGLMISIWLNVGAMKLQYYEEIVKYSSIQTTEVQAGEDTEGEDQNNETQSADGDENINEDDDACPCHKPPPSLTPHELKVLQIICIWVGILSTTSLIPTISKDDMKFVVGVAVNINLIFFYAAPLSTIMTVLRTKSSASIHFWTMLMNTVNAFFWCVYSLAIQDYYILIPNGLGFVFGIFQMMLYNCYPHNNDIDRDGTEQFLDDDGNSKANSRGNETQII